MKSSISWFEIPTRDLGAAQAFYQSLLGCSMRREAMGPSEGAVFPYEGEGIGGALICGPSANAPSAGGVVVYLDCSPSLDAALQRAIAAGGVIAMPRQALPPGMGFIALMRDLDGNTVGLHALA